MTMTAELTLTQAARIVREAVRDKSYRLLPLGEDVAAYLHAKRKRLTPASYRDYEGSLDKFVRFFCDLELQDFEPPIGTWMRLRRRWRTCSARTTSDADPA